VWIWKPLEAGSCGLEWLIQRERERERESERGGYATRIAVMNLISVHVQVVNAEQQGFSSREDEERIKV